MPVLYSTWTYSTKAGCAYEKNLYNRSGALNLAPLRLIFSRGHVSDLRYVSCRFSTLATATEWKARLLVVGSTDMLIGVQTIAVQQVSVGDLGLDAKPKVGDEGAGVDEAGLLEHQGDLDGQVVLVVGAGEDLGDARAPDGQEVEVVAAVLHVPDAVLAVAEPVAVEAPLLNVLQQAVVLLRANGPALPAHAKGVVGRGGNGRLL